MNVTIEPLNKTDIDEYNLFLEKIITEGFIDTGIDIVEEKQHLTNEIYFQKNRVIRYPKQYYLAKMNNHIVASIAFMDPCEAVKITSQKLRIPHGEIKEIVAVYVHKDFRKIGIGSDLFKYMLRVLHKKKVKYFALSTGYTQGKAFWTHMLGKESIILPTYYEGHPCNVWIRKLNDIL